MRDVSKTVPQFRDHVGLSGVKVFETVREVADLDKLKRNHCWTENTKQTDSRKETDGIRSIGLSSIVFLSRLCVT